MSMSIDMDIDINMHTIMISIVWIKVLKLIQTHRTRVPGSATSHESVPGHRTFYEYRYR